MITLNTANLVVLRIIICGTSRHGMLKKGSTGELGEKIAAKHLQDSGYKILATDFHAGKLGEIDIVAGKDDCLHLIEVKTRSGAVFGTPEESVTFFKRQKLKRAIYYYLSSQKIKTSKYQFDLIAVYLDRITRKAAIKHYQNIEL